MKIKKLKQKSLPFRVSNHRGNNIQIMFQNQTLVKRVKKLLEPYFRQIPLRQELDLS